jgi:hypothetical protein
MVSTILGTTHSTLHIGAMLEVITTLIVVIIIITTTTITIIMAIILIMVAVLVIQNQIGAIILVAMRMNAEISIALRE